jgi:hypothetical protein
MLPSTFTGRNSGDLGVGTMDNNYVSRWMLHAIRYISVAALQYDS